MTEPTPLFPKGVRDIPGALNDALIEHTEARRALLVRAYDSVNVATTAAARYNRRYPDVYFFTSRLNPERTRYGVYAYAGKGRENG